MFTHCAVFMLAVYWFELLHKLLQVNILFFQQEYYLRMKDIILMSLQVTT